MRAMWRDFVIGRELALRLAVRDIRASYRQSILGVFWAFVLPLANSLVWIFLNGTGIVTIRETTIPYPAYVFSGTMLWAIFMESLQAPLQKTQENKSLLSKINFPRESLIVAGIYQTIFNAAIKALIVILALIFWGILPGWSILLFPLGLLSLILAGTTIGLFLTPVGTLYSDIGKGLPIVLQFFMYLTPVVYPIPKAGWHSLIIKYNPLTPLIMTARDWLIGTPADFIYSFIGVNIVLSVVFFIAWMIYRLAMPILIERMSA